MRALAVLAACLLLWGSAARADTIDTSVHQLADSSFKVRLAAALGLSKSRDARAVIALARALAGDDDATIRRVAALALGKMIDAHTADNARELGLDALAGAAAGDADPAVQATAQRTLQDLAGLRRRKKEARADPRPDVRSEGRPEGRASVRSEARVDRPEARVDRPEVFVHIEGMTDQSRVAPHDAGERLARVVKQTVERTGYSTSWPGGLPTQTELTTSHSRAFIVASTVRQIDIARVSRQTQVSCKLEIRVAPWSGIDGGEKWEANKAASASGSAKAMTGNSDREIASGVRDCLEAVAEDVTARHILPFLKRLANTGS